MDGGEAVGVTNDWLADMEVAIAFGIERHEECVFESEPERVTFPTFLPAMFDAANIRSSIAQAVIFQTGKALNHMLTLVCWHPVRKSQQHNVPNRDCTIVSRREGALSGLRAAIRKSADGVRLGVWR